MESQCGLVTIVTALIASATFFVNQQLSSLSSTFLLRDVILMFVVCESILTSACAKFSLPADQFCFADETYLFHMTSKVGLQAYHIQF